MAEPAIRSSNHLLDSALSYAAQGWAVFPLHSPARITPCDCGKPKCASAGKHPRTVGGFTNATTDPSQITAWWRQWPRANIGIACGASGLVVLDVDPRHGGIQSLVELVSRHALTPPTMFANRTQAMQNLYATLVSETGSGGEHLLFQAPLQAALQAPPNAASDPIRLSQELDGLPGLDVRADGGYIVAAPSLHVSGARYQWRDADADLTPAPLPVWLERVMRQPRAGSAPSAAARPPLRLVPPDGDALPGAYWLERALHLAHEGNRNAQGFWLACQLRDDGLSQQDAEPVMLDYAHRTPGEDYTEREALDSLRQAYRRPRRDPARSANAHSAQASGFAEQPADYHKNFTAPTDDQDNQADGSAPEGGLKGGDEAPVHRTDMGNARRFVTQHGALTRYVGLWGHWMTWDGRRWRHDWNGETTRLAKETVRGIYQEALDSADDLERRELLKWALRSESRDRLTAMLQVAQSEPEVAYVPDAFDSHPWLLCAQNGVLDLRTGRLGPHSAAYGITRLAPVEYDPRAQCPLWLQFLDRIMGANQHLITFLQRAVGYSLTDSTSAQVMFLLHGNGANGKSVFLQAIEGVLGEYGMSTPTSTLMAKRDNNIPNDVARLKGARFVKAVETEDGHALAESLVKQMTGGDMLTARFMRGEWFDFKPTFKLWLAANHLPTIRGTDDGIWRRIRYIPFEVQIPEAERDEELGEKLRAEYPGILAWAVQGCLAWQRDGLGYPEAMRVASDSYRARMDTIGQFLGEVTEPYATATMSAKRLFGAYSSWCEESGERPATQTRFGRYLSDHGYHKERLRDGYVWVGLRLRESVNDTPTPAPPGGLF